MIHITLATTCEGCGPVIKVLLTDNPPTLVELENLKRVTGGICVILRQGCIESTDGIVELDLPK